MALIGNQLSSAENNSYRVLDNLASFTLTFDGSSSANVLASTDTIALSQHPFVTGQRVTYSSNGGSPIGGLLSGTAYYITKTDQNSFKLASSYVNAITNITIDLVGTGTGVTHSFNVAFDGVNTKFKATYSNGTKCTISRAPQLDIAINGVVQQPYDSNPPPNGFTIEADATIVFSTAPLSGYTFWGKALSGSIASVENSDNSIDNFTGNGSTTNFTLSKTPTNSQNVLVTINGVTQYPSDATGTRSYSTNANVLVFTAPPANGSLIQVRYIGFAGPTSSNVTGFYGRTGNVVLNSSDGIGVGTAKIGTGIVGLATALLVEGNVRITGILTIGTSSITLNGSTGSTDSIVVGSSFIRNNSIGLGQTTTTGRNAGVGTAIGTIIYNSTTGLVEVYDGSSWQSTSDRYLQASGGIVTTYYSGGVLWAAHTFTSSGTFSVVSAPPNNNTVEYLVVAGGGGGNNGGGVGGGGGGAGGFRTGIGLTVSSAPGVYTISVGSGGARGEAPAVNVATRGNPSFISSPGITSITSTGGGAGVGGNTTFTPGTQPGGSGGGSGTNDPGYTPFGTGAGNTPPTSPPQGNPGGFGSDVWEGGGGGGAGAAGSILNGGNGSSSSISGSSVTYAGGGGGGRNTWQGGGSAGSGGSGGGGSGGNRTGPTAENPGTAGTTNLGGGGGGGGRNVGAAGGSGVVIIRYQVGQQSVKATGGTVSYAGGKTIHTFTSSATFTVRDPSLTSVDYLVVGGGAGGGGSNTGGGGGAGAFRVGSGIPISATPGSYQITVGAGGNGGSGSAGTGSNGADSIFSTITSNGGSAGAGNNASAPVNPGNGSGGGGGGGGVLNGPGSSGGAYGNPGGSAGGGFGGGGGGGAGGSGGTGATGAGGTGGPGTSSSISGTSVTYAGGGAGGHQNNAPATPGSPGGGGAGGRGPGGSPASGSPGTVATGGGGGGAGYPGSGNDIGGNGGSGIVIISYPS